MVKPVNAKTKSDQNRHVKYSTWYYPFPLKHICRGSELPSGIGAIIFLYQSFGCVSLPLRSADSHSYTGTVYTVETVVYDYGIGCISNA